MLKCVVVTPYLNWCTEPNWFEKPLQQAFLSGFVMAIVLFCLFLFQEWHKSRNARSAYARSVWLELNTMRGMFWPAPGTRPRLRSVVAASDLPRSTYDGLVASAAVSKFSDGVQRQLARFYGLLSSGNINAMQRSIIDLMEDVGKEKAVKDWWKFWMRIRSFLQARKGSTTQA